MVTRSVEDITSVDNLTSTDDIALGDEFKGLSLLNREIESTVGDTSSPKLIFDQPRTKISLDNAKLAPDTVKTATLNSQNAAVFRALEITPGQQLSSDQFSTVLQKASKVEQSSLSATSLSLAYDPFSPELELYFGSPDTSSQTNDPFPNLLLATAPFTPTTVPALGKDSFVNGRGSKVGFNVDLQRNQVSTPTRKATLLPGYNSVAGTEVRDIIKGNNNDNILFGFGGNDVIRGSGGSDVISGGAGYDTVSYQGSGTAITLNQFGKISKSTGGTDSLRGEASAPLTATVERIIGDRKQTNSINVVGAPSAIEANLEAGFLNIDSVNGGGRKGDFDIFNFNNVFGGRGDDVIKGDQKNNVLSTGGIGAIAAPDNDSIDGGLGKDLIIGGSGLDTLLGGGGADTFRLGDRSGYFYRDSSFLGTEQFATLSDFQTGVDKISLQGTAADYVFLGSGNNNTLILRDVDKSGGFSLRDDLVANVSTGFAASDVSFA